MKILIADDENAMRSILSHFMEQYPSPYTDYMIVDTGEALRNACLQSPPEIVFSDIRMPDLSGLEAIYEIKQAVESETTNYYIISGFGEFEYAQKAIKLGIKDYILKPVRYSTIEKILMDEERNHFLGLSLETAWSIRDERKALELSGCIQNLAASFQEGGQAFFNTLSEWKKKSEEKAIAIDPAFFAKRFGKDEGCLHTPFRPPPPHIAKRESLFPIVVQCLHVGCRQCFVVEAELVELAGEVIRPRLFPYRYKT